MAQENNAPPPPTPREDQERGCPFELKVISISKRQIGRRRRTLAMGSIFMKDSKKGNYLLPCLPLLKGGLKMVYSFPILAAIPLAAATAASLSLAVAI